MGQKEEGVDSPMNLILGVIVNYQKHEKCLS